MAASQSLNGRENRMRIRLLLLSALALLTSALACRTAGDTEEEGVRRRIAAGVAAIRLIDTHEHLGPEGDRVRPDRSLFDCLHYALSDMWAAGLDRSRSEAVLPDSAVSAEEKWRLIAPYWEASRNTAYCKSLERAFRDLYGVPELSDSTWRELSERIAAASRPGLYARVLREQAGIELAICDVGQPGAQLDRSLFRAVRRLDEYFLFWDAFGQVERDRGSAVRTLEDWEQALDAAVARAKADGFVGIKSGIAYERSLAFDLPSRAEAAQVFDQLRASREPIDRIDWRRKQPLQDHVLHLIAESCARHDLPLQLHTGLFYDMWHEMDQTNPALLSRFISAHPRTRFVLMHCGYPYGRELLAMAKNLPNVTLDMCWAYVISPRFAAGFLDEAIETVPRDKLLGFGGDYVIPEGSYGHAMLCREVVSRVLADKVLEGYWSEAEALDYARAILRDNPLRVFGIGL